MARCSVDITRRSWPRHDGLLHASGSHAHGDHEVARPSRAATGRRSPEEADAGRCIRRAHRQAPPRLNGMKAYIQLIKVDIKLALRQRVVIFFNYLFPLVFFFGMSSAFKASTNAGTATYVLTMSLVLGVLGSGLFGAGVRAIQEREMNILRRYKVTPITSGPILLASMVTGWVIFMPSIVMLVVISHFSNNLPWPSRLPTLLVFMSVALIAFRSIGLVIASVANTMQ